MPLGLSSSRLSPLPVPHLRLRNLRYRRLTENQVLASRPVSDSNQLPDSLFRRVTHGKCPRSPSAPAAETSTVISSVGSAGVIGGLRESPVHLEGHRLVHDRLVGRV